MLLRATRTERCRPCEIFFDSIRHGTLDDVFWFSLKFALFRRSREFGVSCHFCFDTLSINAQIMFSSMLSVPTTLARGTLLCFLHGAFTNVLLRHCTANPEEVSVLSLTWMTFLSYSFGVGSKQITQSLSMPVRPPHRAFVWLQKFVRLVLLFRGFCPVC